jgi:L-alanine-DL-glutamate epimerase-like enolase superfamily enzyme
VVIEATAEDGRTLVGVGESDANPWIMRECVETFGTHVVGLGIKQMLLGENALEIERLWQKMYAGTYMNGRRGIVLHTMGAVEMALWDLKGKYYNKPTWQLLDRPARPEGKITPYASLQPEGVSTVSEYKEELCSWVGRAKQLGFKAGKCEVTLSGPYAHLGMTAGDERITEIVEAARDEAGSPESFQIMVDVQYTWDDADRALKTLNQWAELGIFFCETPLPLDDLDGIAKLASQSPVRIAFGEMQSHHSEFYDLFDRGGIQVGQPDVGRVGGLMEALKVCDMAAERERIIVPHCWKTGVGIAATMQMAAVTPHCAYIEFLPAAICASQLRQKLTLTDPEFIDGTLALPDRPGLGVDVNWECVEQYNYEKVIAENPHVKKMIAELRSPMGPSHDLWKAAGAYDQGSAAGAAAVSSGNPWVAKPALTLLGAGVILGGLGMRLARI